MRLAPSLPRHPPRERATASALLRCVPYDPVFADELGRPIDLRKLTESFGKLRVARPV